MRVAAGLVSIQILIASAVRETGEQQHVVLGKFERPKKRRQFRERAGLFHFPRFKHRAAGDREDAHAQRRRGGDFAREGGDAPQAIPETAAPSWRRRPSKSRGGKVEWCACFAVLEMDRSFAKNAAVFPSPLGRGPRRYSCCGVRVTPRDFSDSISKRIPREPGIYL